MFSPDPTGVPQPPSGVPVAYRPPRLIFLGTAVELIRGGQEGHHLDESDAWTYYHMPPNPYQ